MSSSLTSKVTRSRTSVLGSIVDQLRSWPSTDYPRVALSWPAGLGLTIVMPPVHVQPYSVQLCPDANTYFRVGLVTVVKKNIPHSAAVMTVLSILACRDRPAVLLGCMWHSLMILPILYTRVRYLYHIRCATLCQQWFPHAQAIVRTVHSGATVNAANRLLTQS
jgi:hypothetical protein